MKNVSPDRKVDKAFSAIPRTKRLGPIPQSNSMTPIQQVVFDSNQNVVYNDWGVMSNFTEGLRQALIGWINTTKEGKVVLNSSGSTRSKTINFQFYGNPSNVMVGNGDIGTFSLSFKYTKSVVTTSSSKPGSFPILTR